MAKLIFGCGYLGRRVARLWRNAGETVHVVTRSDSRAAELLAEGLQPLVADVTAPQSLMPLPRATTVLYAVGYDRDAGRTMREVYVEGLRNVLEVLPQSTERFVYISSTGVYAQNDGGWVDEDSPCQPRRESGQVCLAAERLILETPWAGRAVVLRLAGIYGPGRIPRRAALEAGEAIAAPSDGWLNLIHVDDAARIVLAAEHLSPPRLYTISDGQPPQRRAYYEELARLLNAPAPRFIEPPIDSPAARRAESNKRVSNRRMRADLACSLQFPTFREGLAAIVAGE